MQVLLLLIIGLSIGTVSGALGIGGGVLLIPALIWLCRYDFPRAAGTTLAVLVPPIGLPAAWVYYKRNLIDVQAAVWIALAFTLGAMFGASIAHYLPERLLRLCFGLLMMYIAARFLIVSDSEVAHAAAGIAAVCVGWLSFLSLRLLGRRHLPKPDLGQEIRTSQQQGRSGADYHI
jgi:uncharacterized protein